MYTVTEHQTVTGPTLHEVVDEDGVADRFPDEGRARRAADMLNRGEAVVDRHASAGCRVVALCGRHTARPRLDVEPGLMPWAQARFRELTRGEGMCMVDAIDRVLAELS